MSTRPEAEQWLSEFGVRIRALRNEANMSQAELAHTADLHPTYLSGIERGHRNVSLINIHALARALQVSPEELFRGHTGRT